jgi:hypothetical protein
MTITGNDDGDNGNSGKRRHTGDPLDADSSRKRTKEEAARLDSEHAATGSLNGNGAMSAATAATVAQSAPKASKPSSVAPFEGKPAALGSTSSDAGVMASLPPAVTEQSAPSTNTAAQRATTAVKDAATQIKEEILPDVLTSTVTTYEEVTTTITTSKSPLPSRFGGSTFLLLMATILIWFHVILGGIWLLPGEEHALQLHDANRQVKQLRQELSDQRAQIEQVEQDLEDWKIKFMNLEGEKRGWQLECREHVDAVLANRNLDGVQETTRGSMMHNHRREV